MSFWDVTTALRLTRRHCDSDLSDNECYCSSCPCLSLCACGCHSPAPDGKLPLFVAGESLELEPERSQSSLYVLEFIQLREQHACQLRLMSCPFDVRVEESPRTCSCVLSPADASLESSSSSAVSSSSSSPSLHSPCPASSLSGPSPGVQHSSSYVFTSFVSQTWACDRCCAEGWRESVYHCEEHAFDLCAECAGTAFETEAGRGRVPFVPKHELDKPACASQPKPVKGFATIEDHSM